MFISFGDYIIRIDSIGIIKPVDGKLAEKTKYKSEVVFTSGASVLVPYTTEEIAKLLNKGGRC